MDGGLRGSSGVPLGAVDVGSVVLGVAGAAEGWLGTLLKNRSSVSPVWEGPGVEPNKSFNKSLLLEQFFIPVSGATAGGQGSEFRPSRSSVSGWGSEVVNSTSNRGSLASRDRVPSAGAE